MKTLILTILLIQTIWSQQLYDPNTEIESHVLAFLPVDNIIPQMKIYPKDIIKISYILEGTYTEGTISNQYDSAIKKIIKETNIGVLDSIKLMPDEYQFSNSVIRNNGDRSYWANPLFIEVMADTTTQDTIIVRPVTIYLQFN